MERFTQTAFAALIAAIGILASASGAWGNTTLEVGGTPKHESVAITASLEAGTSLVLARTDGTPTNTCEGSHVNGSTESPYTGTEVTGKITELTFTDCTSTVHVHNAGQLYVEHISGTTNGTVYSENAEVTVATPFGTVVNCKPGAGTDIGKLTGKTEGNATLDIDAVLNCGFQLPSALWKGSYTITSPSGLGVTDEEPPEPTTTLEVGGTPKGEPVAITASLESSTSIVLARTDGSLANTCANSHVSGSTESPYSGSKVTGALTSISFSGCTNTVTVHKAGQLYIEHIPGTTNGTVFSENAEVTVKTAFGNTVNCKTNEGTDIGKLTGVASGNATMDIDAVLNCGFLLPSSTLKGSYTITSPSGLGVTDQEPPETTTLEVGGTPKGEPVEITASIEAATSLVLARTDGSFANTCKGSHLTGSSESPYTGTEVTGKITELSFTECANTVHVHNAGQLYIEHIPGTTNGTVFSENAEVTVKTAFGNTVNCKTNEGTDIGKLTGVASGNATMDIDAVLNCGFLLPSSTLKGSYTITSPSGLGVTT